MHPSSFVLAVAAGALAWSPMGDAGATQRTPTYAGVTCRITATQPTLSSTSQLAARASITCSKDAGVAATSVTVNYAITVVEMDGTTEQALSSSFQKNLTTTVVIGTPLTITSYKLWCPNTEAGGEEYASKSSVMIVGAGTWSAPDRSKPVLDQFNC